MSASLSATVTGSKLPKSQSAAKAPQVGWNDVHVRPFSWNDIDRMVDYMFRSPRDLPFLRAIDFEKFPRENDYRAMLNDIASSFAQKPWLTIEYKGQPIGVHPLTGFDNGQADFHAHIWNSQLWGKGIGVVSWFKACAYFFEHLESLETLFIRVPKDNPMPTGWAKKLLRRIWWCSPSGFWVSMGARKSQGTSLVPWWMSW